MLYTHKTDEPNYLLGAVYPDVLARGGYSGHGPWWDPVAQLLRTAVFYLQQPVVHSVLLGQHGPRFEEQDLDFDRKPVHEVYSRAADFRRYQNTMSLGLTILFNGLESVTSFNTTHGEKQVLHSKVHGQVHGESKASTIFEKDRSWTIAGVTSNGYDVRVNYDGCLLDENGLIDQSFDSGWPARYDARDIIEAMETHYANSSESWFNAHSIYVGGSKSTRRYDCTVTNLSVEWDEVHNLPKKFTYDILSLHWYTGNRSYFQRYDLQTLERVTREVDYSLTTVYGEPSDTGTFMPRARLDLREDLSVTNRLKRSRNEDGSWEEWTSQEDYTSSKSADRHCLRATYISSKDEQVAFHNSHFPRRLGNWQEGAESWFANSALKDLRPSASRTCQAAIQPIFEEFENNYIETLAELSTLGQVLPSLKPVMEAVTAIRKGKLIRAGAKLVDTFTDSKLLYEFGVAPNEEAAKELTEKFWPLVDKLNRIVDGDTRTLYAYKWFDLPDDFCPVGPSRLLTHSKVVLTMDFSSTIQTIMATNSLGILPRLGNVWDAIPFSFLVDKIWRIGTRLDNVDYSTLLAALRVKYVVNSYKLFVDLQEHVQSHGLTANAGSSPPVLTLYKREVSSWPTPYRNSRIDFDSQSDVNFDVGIYGSLLWKALPFKG